MKKLSIYLWSIFTVGISLVLHAQNIPPPASVYVQEVAVAPDQGNIVYAATTGAGLFRSTDGAATWQRIDNRATDGQFYVVKIDPKNPRRIYAGGERSGVWISDDRGTTWKSAGLAGVTINDLAIDPENGDKAFVLAYEGIYRTKDLQRGQWELVFDYQKYWIGKIWNGPSDEPKALGRFQKITINPHNPQQIIAGVRWEGGYTTSDDGGDTWRNATLSGIFRRVDVALFHPTEANVVFAGTHHQGMFKSWNSGKSWVSMSRGLEPQKRTPWYNAYLIGGMVIDPRDPNTLYSGSDYSNWKSTDSGLHWHEMGRTLTCEFARTFAVDRNQPDTVYAGTNVGIYKSTDGGATWRPRNHGFPEKEILQALDVKTKEGHFQYAVVKGQPAVFRRSLDGKDDQNSDWTPMSWMLYTPASGIAFDAQRSELILKTPAGDIRSDDFGLRWQTSKMTEGPRVAPAPLDHVAPDRGPRGDEISLNVKIVGDVFFDDSQIEPYYQRTPYVSLQLVLAGYPVDKSTPICEANWDRSVEGVFRVPKALLSQYRSRRLLLYVEVRDFHQGTLTGWAPVATDEVLRGAADLIEVKVDAERLLPALSGE